MNTLDLQAIEDIVVGLKGERGKAQAFISFYQECLGDHSSWSTWICEPSHRDTVETTKSQRVLCCHTSHMLLTILRHRGLCTLPYFELGLSHIGAVKKFALKIGESCSLITMLYIYGDLEPLRLPTTTTSLSHIFGNASPSRAIFLVARRKCWATQLLVDAFAQTNISQASRFYRFRLLSEVCGHDRRLDRSVFRFRGAFQTSSALH